MNTKKITQQDINEMVLHWLHTPVGTYLGSSYGFDKQALLFQPLTTMAADEMIAKLKRDIPILSILAANTINFFSMPIPPDKTSIFLQVGEQKFDIF